MIFRAIALLGLGVLYTSAAGLTHGSASIGFRTETLPARDGLPAGRIQLWYPAAAACAAPLTYGDYLRGDAQFPGDDVGAQLRQGWAMGAPAVDDAQWTRVVAAPMRACRDAAAATGRAPLIVAIELGGAWPVAAEYFASHGYAFASVGRPISSPPAGPLVNRVAARKQEFVRDLEAALAQLRGHADLDLDRVGALGQNHALLMLAMRQPAVRAIALQDSGFQAGVDAESDRLTGFWHPSELHAALLHAISLDRIAAETGWDDVRTTMRGEWTRLIIVPPQAAHNDVTADGYLIRTRAPITGPPHDTAIALYEGLLAAQRAFFDRHVAGRAGAPSLESSLDRTLFRVEKK